MGCSTSSTIKPQPPTKMSDPNFATAQKFFAACEAGKGWDACKQYVADGATFSGRGFVGSLKDIPTVEGYTSFMVGIMVVMPGSSYDLKFQGYDAERKAACFYAIYNGTNTADCDGFPPHTGKTIASDYAYNLEFNDAGKIKSMVKIWNDAYCMAEAGWM
eukprot:m.15420 g.15420  ORF g.15420 m.15420 type:complete len:160 (-) comp10566_c1_seq1:41-520(-)